MSPFKYNLEGIITNEFEGLDSPLDVIALNNYTIGKWNCAIIVFGFFIIFQIIGCCVLYLKRGTLL